MNKGAYELIKLLIQNVDQQLEFTLATGKHIVIDIQPDKLISELDKVINIEKEADWLATFIGRHECIKGTPESTICPSDEACMNCWREAARKAVAEADNA